MSTPTDLDMGIALAGVAQVVLFQRAEQLAPRSPAGAGFLHTLSEIAGVGVDFMRVIKEADDSDTLPAAPGAPAAPSSVE